MGERFDSESVRAIIIHNNKILIEWIAEKSLAFAPGGRIEAGESHTAALTRELFEEIDGMDLSIGRYMGKIGHIWKGPEGAGSCLNYLYEVKILQDRGVRAKEPGREIRWLDLASEDAQFLKPPSLRRMLKEEGTAGPWNVVDSEP